MTNAFNRKGLPYIDRCRSVVNGINPNELSRLEIQRVAGETNHSFTPNTRTFSLGALALKGDSIYLAAKIDPDNPIRLETELKEAAILSDVAPITKAMLPFFLSRLALQGRTLGILTEDVTRMGAVDLRPTKLSERIKKLLVTAFQERDDLCFDPLKLDRAAFLAGGEERLLDLSPPSVMGHPSMPRDCYYFDTLVAVDEASEDLVVEIDPSSPLAQSVADAGII